MDDLKYKVYIYNLDDELLDDDFDIIDLVKFVFLKDIEKYFNFNCIFWYIFEKFDLEEEGK